jgi:hypothetical protein
VRGKATQTPGFPSPAAETMSTSASRSPRSRHNPRHDGDAGPHGVDDRNVKQPFQSCCRREEQVDEPLALLQVPLGPFPFERGQTDGFELSIGAPPHRIVRGALGHRSALQPSVTGVQHQRAQGFRAGGCQPYPYGICIMAPLVALRHAMIYLVSDEKGSCA